MRLAACLRLNFHDDLRTLGIVAFTYLLYILCWCFRATPIHWSLKFCMWWTLAIFSWFCATIVHNCIHVPQFRDKWMNSAWQIVLALAYGYPVSVLVPGHNLSHHKYTQGPKDVIRTTKMRWQYNLLNVLFFIPTVVLAIKKQDAKYMDQQRQKGRPIFRQACKETAVFLVVNILLLAWDWRTYIVFVALPQAFAKVGIISINLPQHDGCPPPEEDRYNFARNFTGPILNFFTCNNGYHTIHHMHPGMHWSKLKEQHERVVKPHMHPSLDQPNLLWYIFVTYVLPGGRVMYDGSPYRMPPPIPDEPWFTEDTTETYSDGKTS